MKGPEPNSRTILCVIDFSPPSMEALRWAIQVAADHRAHLTILYPYRLNHLGRRDDLSQLKRNIVQEAAVNFQKITDDFLKNACVSYDFRAEVGFINDRIYSYSQQNDIRLLVIGKALAAHNKEALDELIGQLRVPLVIIPQNEPALYETSSKQAINA